MTDRFLIFSKAIWGIGFYFSPDGFVFKCLNRGIKLSRFPFKFYFNLNCGLDDFGYVYLPKSGAKPKAWSLNEVLLGKESRTFVSNELAQEIPIILDGKIEKIYYRYGYFIFKRKRSFFSSKMEATEIVSNVLPEITKGRITPYDHIDPEEIPETVICAKRNIEAELGDLGNQLTELKNNGNR